MNNASNQFYQEREARFSDAVNLKIPDRVTGVLIIPCLKNNSRPSIGLTLKK